MSKPFTASMIKALPKGDNTDGGCKGLQLRVQSDGIRSWLFRFSWEGSQQRMTIGQWPETSPADARDKVSELRKQWRAGIDPRTAIQRKVKRPAPVPGGAALVGVNARYSFDYLVSEFIEQMKRDSKNPEEPASHLRSTCCPSGRDAMRAPSSRSKRRIC